MNDKYVFQNFDHSLMTLSGAIQYVKTRILTLEKQGFNKEQIQQIIFDDSLFSECFTNPAYFKQVMNAFYQ